MNTVCRSLSGAGGCQAKLSCRLDGYKEVYMSQAQRAAKLEKGKNVEVETSRESVEVAEAIKALQVQLADLRKIVQAAKTSGDDVVKPGSRQ